LVKHTTQQETMQVHPNNNDAARCRFHSSNDNDTFSPPMKNEQSDKYIWMTVMFMWWSRLLVLSCNNYHGIQSKLILTMCSFLSHLFSLLHFSTCIFIIAFWLIFSHQKIAKSISEGAQCSKAFLILACCLGAHKRCPPRL
jgi:hypothetical protein